MKLDLSDPAEYQNRIQYFSFEAENDIVCIQGSDTIPSQFVHLERTFGVSPKITLLCSFQSEPTKNKKKTIILKDRIFSKETITWVFDNNALASIPNISRG